MTGSRGAGRLVMTSPGDSGVLKYGSERNSTFTLKPKRWDRELVCAARNPAGGESYNATVTLNVQCESETRSCDKAINEITLQSRYINNSSNINHNNNVIEYTLKLIHNNNLHLNLSGQISDVKLIKIMSHISINDNINNNI